MRSWFLTLFFLASISLFAQFHAVPTCDVKISSASLAFGVNIGAGQKIYEIDTYQLFECVKGEDATQSIASSLGNGGLRDLGDYNSLENTPTIPGGTVTAVSVVTANGVSGTSSGGATPALTIALGAITPISSTWSIPATNNTGTGNMIYIVAGIDQKIGDVCFINSSSTTSVCKADAIANCPYCFCMLAQSAVSSGGDGLYVTHGAVRYDTWSWTAGGLIYVSTVGKSGSTLTQTPPPSGTNNVVMPIGIALSATTIFFFGNMNSVEHL
jgi:hypothetical protein